jgi:hypothetical protein
LKTEEACLITTSKRSQPSTWCSDWEVETEHDPMNNLFKQFFFSMASYTVFFWTISFLQ